MSNRHVWRQMSESKWGMKKLWFPRSDLYMIKWWYQGIVRIEVMRFEKDCYLRVGSVKSGAAHMCVILRNRVSFKFDNQCKVPRSSIVYHWFYVNCKSDTWWGSWRKIRLVIRVLRKTESELVGELAKSGTSRCICKDMSNRHVWQMSLKWIRDEKLWFPRSVGIRELSELRWWDFRKIVISFVSGKCEKWDSLLVSDAGKQGRFHVG